MNNSLAHKDNFMNNSLAHKVEHATTILFKLDNHYLELDFRLTVIDHDQTSVALKAEYYVQVYFCTYLLIHINISFMQSLLKMYFEKIIQGMQITGSLN